MLARLRVGILLGVFLLAMDMATLARSVERSPVGGKNAEPRSSASATALRQREGASLVDALGTFKLTGDRATFSPADSDQRYLGLENLNLERVALVVGENPERLEWLVSGLVTEFRGSNYLLITKAILKNKSRAAPAR